MFTEIERKDSDKLSAGILVRVGENEKVIGDCSIELSSSKRIPSETSAFTGFWTVDYTCTLTGLLFFLFVTWHSLLLRPHGTDSVKLILKGVNVISFVKISVCSPH